MRLKNKKTGEIGEVGYLAISDGKIMVKISINYQDELYEYNSLADLNEEWEDAPEEPKEWWYIDIHGPHNVIKNDEYYQVVKEASKEIGNYFETKEESEKAVEKLKAWKRLKDKGFRFNRWTIPEEPKTPHIKLVIEADMDVPDSPYDLDICFGGEE